VFILTELFSSLPAWTSPPYKIPPVNPTFLGGLTATDFLRHHWQKTPLLIRGALPGFSGVVDLREMIRLAGRDDCESRLVLRHGNRWTVEHGPFAASRFRRLPARNWTLLVQGLDTLAEEARELLGKFRFIPYSRLDDLMVSFATAGGGVGPHFDSYDVFLLQGPGRRRWQVSRQRDLALRDDLPLKILQRFKPQGDAVLHAGDMLYLPPEFAHDGVALEECQTYSIGFRAPTYRELASEFLMFLEERLSLRGRYSDPGLHVQDPADLGNGTLRQISHALSHIRWSNSDVADFCGAYLTEPKPRLQFFPPAQPLAMADFLRASRQYGLRLALGSRMLYRRDNLYINGEILHGAATRPLRRLANDGRLAAAHVPRDVVSGERLYQWYRAGYILSGATFRMRVDNG
jgi:50S ribosomal protein L16 3-hydroxylase